MPRKKGPGTLNNLRPAERDFVEIRVCLRRGGEHAKQQTSSARFLEAELRKLQRRQEELRAFLASQSAAHLPRADVEPAWTELAQIRKGMIPAKTALTNERGEASRFGRRKPVFDWQEKLTLLVEIALHRPQELAQLKCLLDEETRLARAGDMRTRLIAALRSGMSLPEWLRRDAERKQKLWAIRQRLRSNTLSPAGQYVDCSASQFLNQLRAEGFSVHHDDTTAERMIRRFLTDKLHVSFRSEQGERRDLLPLRTIA